MLTKHSVWLQLLRLRAVLNKSNVNDFRRNYLHQREVRFGYVQGKSTSLKQMCADTNVCIITWCSLGVTEPVLCVFLFRFASFSLKALHT